MMKLFHLYRAEDHSGVSGTGPVVEGVEFTNGWCALRWITAKSSLCFYQTMEEVKAIHGHGGKTELIVHDFEPLRKRETPGGDYSTELLMQIIEESARILSYYDDENVEAATVRDAIDAVKALLDELGRNIVKSTPSEQESA